MGKSAELYQWAAVFLSPCRSPCSLFCLACPSTESLPATLSPFELFEVWIKLCLNFGKLCVGEGGERDSVFDYDNNAGLIHGLDLFAVKLEQSNGVLHFVPRLQVFQLDFLFILQAGTVSACTGVYCWRHSDIQFWHVTQVRNARSTL